MIDPRVGRKLVRRPLVVAAAAVVGAFVLVAVAAPQLAPFDPVTTNLLAMRKPPSAVHRLSTDEVRSLYGAVAGEATG